MPNFNGRLIYQKRNPADYSSSVFAEVDGLSAYEVALNEGFVGTEEEWLDSLVGIPGLGLPPGGTTGQIHVKISDSDYDSGWADPAASGVPPSIVTGSGAPTVTPAKSGDLYIDTLNNHAYVSVGITGPSDWEISGPETVISYVDNALDTLKTDLFKKINHGSDSNVARPSGWAGIIWVGTVNPVNAIGDDLIIRTDEAV